MKGDAPLLLGLNKYSHSASACLFEEDGRVLFALAKERITRKKHDGGDVADLVRYLLEATGRRLSEVRLVVQQNHLFRIEPYERSLRFAEALHAAPPSSLDPHNLLPHAERWELSHHLAHAWSVLPVAPFDEGLIAVMDGMGSPREIVEARRVPHLVNESRLPRGRDFLQVPARPAAARRWREAETLYSFRGNRLRLLFKRWTEERSPDFLYNYGFENMESLGAVYSRISSHIFGDWNQCGKVMGLAAYGRARPDGAFLRGRLEKLGIDWERLQGLPHPNDWGTDRNLRLYEDLAAQVQGDLERVVLDFLRRWQRRTKHRNLCFTGGVALNSLLNGRIAREAGFAEVFVPPYPGDEGVAFGCAHYGLQELRRCKPSRTPPPPFQGRSFSEKELREALEEFSPWISFRKPSRILPLTAASLARHELVGWFQGRSEFGPRALGNRSILAHPVRRGTAGRLNRVKGREAFRPFAPTVLAECAGDFFDAPTASPYMSFTVRPRKTARGRIPAVVHADGTSRIQTLRREDNPRFYDLIQAFRRRTGLPLLLNTSFNIEGEPIVESPREAIRSFMDSGLDLLVLESCVVRKKAFPSGRSLGRCRPRRSEGILVETRSLSSGEISGVSLFLEGRPIDEDELGLALLRACDGRTSARAIFNELGRTFGARNAELAKRLRRLWDRRFVRLS